MDNLGKTVHDKSVKEVLDLLATHDDGLTNQEASLRLEQYGPNKLTEQQREGPLKIFLRQFHDVLIYILIAAAIISMVVNERVDAYVIFAILIFNAIFGFIQEFKAEKAIELLQQLTTLNARVIRGGSVVSVPSTHIVKGDILLLEAGDKVAADARVIEAHNLRSDESALTGESTPVNKQASSVAKSATLADRTDMVFSGTSVVRGTGKAVVTSTGMATEIGNIARMVQEAEHHETPLQLKLKEFGKYLGYIILGVCFLVFIIGVLRKMDVLELLLTAIALAVAAVPEGLPAIVTVCLALGVQRMVRRNALVKRLASIETLGCTTVICSDKTGTLTKNEMTVTTCYANHDFYHITGRGYNKTGEYVNAENKHIDPQEVFPKLLSVAISCNNANGEVGDPTERALYWAAIKGKADGRRRDGEIPFDSDKKYMATMHGLETYYKGAPEVLLEMCTGIMIDGKLRRLLPKDKEKILAANTDMATDALRVLAMAFKKGKDMYFLGLMGMIDPPKEDVADALAICEKAGVRAVMITGDHPITAAAIAHKIGMQGQAITGSELKKLDDNELKHVVHQYTIYARMTSEQKVRILKAYQDTGEIVAMTGDGINDAPALKNANVGVAMSIKGTDISRDAADMVLTDDNFSSIVSSVEEGRIIYDNIKKFINYLLSANMAEVGVILVAMLVGLPLPLLPIQILWINLMTDSWPALALGVDPAGRRIMERKPRNQHESIMHGLTSFLVITGIVGTAITLGIFTWAQSQGMGLEGARTLALTTLITFELFRVYSVKSKRPFGNMLNNKWLNIAVLFSFILQLAVIYTPLNKLFKLEALALSHWLPVLGLALGGFLIMEASKAIMYAIQRRKEEH